MRIIDRYLLKGFIGGLLYCLALFFLLFVVIDVFNNLDEFLKNNMTLRIVTSYYLYSLPTIFVQVVPIAVLVAILYTLGNLSRHNEILAFKASGISGFHILAPFLFMGAVLSFGVFLMNEKLVPVTSVNSSAIMEGLIAKGKRNYEERSIQNVTLMAKNNRMVFAREFEISTNTLYDVVLLEDPHRAVQNKITAKKARYEDDAWTFHDTIRYQMNRRGDLEADPVFASSLRIGLDATPADFLKESSQVDFMNTRQLAEHMRHLEGVSKKFVRKLSVDFHYKIAFPFVSLVVVLIGAPLAMRSSSRGGIARGIAVSVAIVLLYFGVNSVCLALGKGGSLPPAFAAWFSNLFFATIGIYLIKSTT